MLLTREFAHTERFCALLKKAFDHVCGADPILGMRQRAFDHFLELGLPEKSKEAFRYVPVRLLYEGNYRVVAPTADLKEQVAARVLPESRKSHLVFINGYFEPTLSNLEALPKKVVVLPMLEAIRSYGTFLQNRWSKTVREEVDPFAMLNLALHPLGVFIYLPPKLQLKDPIQCIFLDEAPDICSIPRLQLFMASQSEVHLITTPMCAGWNNVGIDAALEDGAVLRHTDWNARAGGWNMSASRVTLKRDCQYHYLGATAGGFVSRNTFRIALNGENSEAVLQGIWGLSENDQTHTHIIMEHTAPNCRSLQKFKGILNQTSQASFEGKIVVRKEAQKTEAYQLNHNVLLSEGAIVNTKPNLEIFADDVKASHGATVSQLDADHLFYLQSRGISAALAKALLVEGICLEITDQLSFPQLRKEVLDGIQARLSTR